MSGKHVHGCAREIGPFGCKGGVKYRQTCACGAERHYCDCDQCRAQGSARGAWVMPICVACGRRHPVDRSCGHD